MRNKPYYYFAFVLITLTVWFIFMYNHNLFFLIKELKYLEVMTTMIIGSFIAGSSPEGSAAIAYPVFTLLLHIDPSDTRNFAFAIQSLGMTSASILILNIKMKVEWNYIKYVTIAGIFGLVFGTYYVAPFIAPVMAKLFFVSLWFSFGIVLWRLNQKKDRTTYLSLGVLSRKDILLLLSFGFVGGIISSVFGTGINIFTYCLMVIYYKMDEKVATPSSIIIMTIETIIGFFLHFAIVKDFSQESFNMWLCCIPIVIFFAPLGSYMISKINRINVAQLLSFILVIQFIGAMIVIKPDLIKLLISITTIASGLTIFYVASKMER